jgi:hypothetical protein
MRYLKSFNESIKDIHSICKTYNITNYTINDDGSIDVNDNVDLSKKRLSKLPLKFRNVTGFFDCYNNQLTSLEGAPTTVGSNFYCDNNQLTSLEGAPTTVGGNFYCSNNQLTSLEGAPRTVGGSFDCNNNPISKWWDQIDNKEKLEVFIDLNINSEDPDWINQEKIDYIK